MVKDKGKHTFIDKVKVRYLSDDDKHWAELVNFGHKYVHIPEHYLRDFDRLLMGGIWAQVDIRHQYDEEAKGKRSPFWIESLKPIQLATFDLDEYRECRRQFTTDEWIDLLIRSMGFEPSHFDRRLKLLFLVRLIPLCEPNYNLVELGPRGTGKSYAYQELSPYAILLTGPTTVANLFYNMASGKMGLVGIWDAVGFDEVADLQKMPKEVVTTLKTYCESGTFARGKDALSGTASHRHVRQHEPAGRGDGAVVAPVLPDARRDPRGHGVHRPHPLLPPRLGDPEDAGRVLHGPLRVRGGLPGRGPARTAEAQLHRGHRPPLLARARTSTRVT